MSHSLNNIYLMKWLMDMRMSTTACLNDNCSLYLNTRPCFFYIHMELIKNILERNHIRNFSPRNSFEKIRLNVLINTICSRERKIYSNRFFQSKKNISNKLKSKVFFHQTNPNQDKLFFCFIIAKEKKIRFVINKCFKSCVSNRNNNE